MLTFEGGQLLVWLLAALIESDLKRDRFLNIPEISETSMNQGDPRPGVKIIVKRARRAFAFLVVFNDHHVFQGFILLPAIECGWFSFHWVTWLVVKRWIRDPML